MVKNNYYGKIKKTNEIKLKTWIANLAIVKKRSVYVFCNSHKNKCLFFTALQGGCSYNWRDVLSSYCLVKVQFNGSIFTVHPLYSRSFYITIKTYGNPTLQLIHLRPILWVMLWPILEIRSDKISEVIYEFFWVI